MKVTLFHLSQVQLLQNIDLYYNSSQWRRYPTNNQAKGSLANQPNLSIVHTYCVEKSCMTWD